MDESIVVAVFGDYKFCLEEMCDVVIYKDSRSSDMCPGCGRVGRRVDEAETPPEGGIGETEERIDPPRRCRFRQEHGCSRILCEMRGVPKDSDFRDNYCEEA